MGNKVRPIFVPHFTRPDSEVEISKDVIERQAFTAIQCFQVFFNSEVENLIIDETNFYPVTLNTSLMQPY